LACLVATVFTHKHLLFSMRPIRDREKPHGSPLPHHRTNGSRIRRFGRLSQCTWTTSAHARQPERLLSPRRPRFHPSHRACAPWTRRMRCRRCPGKQLPLFQSPSGEPFRPSVCDPTYYAFCRLLPSGQRRSLSAQPISLAREIPGHRGGLPG
jgi:hypothetical protein